MVEGIDSSLFAPSSEEEILESMLIDYCYGLFHNNQLVAFCICIMNRKTKLSRSDLYERNLCVWIKKGKKSYSDYITFDTIQVLPEYRGYGIQRYFLKEAEELAAKAHANHIIATVAPDNTKSINSFEELEYCYNKDSTIRIYNSRRYLMIKDIKGDMQ